MEPNTICPVDRKEWRKWLKTNHLSEKEIWMIYFKKHTGKDSIPYEDAVEESLCFGWIDSIVKKIDDERYMQKYTPRSKTSQWSFINKKRAQKMIKKGKMTKYGFEKINNAKKKGHWESDSKAIKEILEAIEKDPKAFKKFNSLPPSQQKQHLGWAASAKKQETRKKRTQEVISKLANGQTIGMK